VVHAALAAPITFAGTIAAAIALGLVAATVITAIANTTALVSRPPIASI
jgi:hypothetical protein